VRALTAGDPHRAGQLLEEHWVTSVDPLLEHMKRAEGKACD